MRITSTLVLTATLTFITTIASAATNRIPQFSNDKVNVWKTTIYPHAKEKLAAHRHEHDRVLIAFDDGVLKVVNDKGQSHELVLKKNQAYYLSKDVPNEVHTDENLTSHPIRVMVVELG
jgi:hypothetical protein